MLLRWDAGLLKSGLKNKRNTNDDPRNIIILLKHSIVGGDVLPIRMQLP